MKTSKNQLEKKFNVIKSENEVAYNGIKTVNEWKEADMATHVKKLEESSLRKILPDKLVKLGKPNTLASKQNKGAYDNAKTDKE